MANITHPRYPKFPCQNRFPWLGLISTNPSELSELSLLGTCIRFRTSKVWWASTLSNIKQYLTSHACDGRAEGAPPNFSTASLVPKAIWLANETMRHSTRGVQGVLVVSYARGFLLMIVWLLMRLHTYSVLLVWLINNWDYSTWSERTLGNVLQYQELMKPPSVNSDVTHLEKRDSEMHTHLGLS